MPPAGEAPQPAEGAGAGGQPGEPDDGASRINVAVRCRPISETERVIGARNVIRVMDHRLVILMDPGSAHSNDYLRQDKSREKRYAFDQAFGPEVGTQDVFEATTKPLIGAVLQAYNATIFAYGSTGAGKTFTMIGTQSEPGVMLRTVAALFDKAAEVRKGSDGVGKLVAVRCSFIEVYNENLRDLLSEEGNDGYLDLREDPDKGTCVAGVTETEAETADEVTRLLHMGNRRRTTEPTAMNVTSSRSHAVLQVAVEQREPGQVRDVLLGKLSMIDLAGSERASQTENRGARLIEGANINRSLLALGNCINALASGVSFVPYRDSKLTRMLKDSLGGNCRTVMIANVSPSHHSFEDTLNTLKYANRAKNIRVSARQNRIQPDAHVSEYEKAIGDLRNEVMLLRSKLARREAPAPPPDGGGGASVGDERQLTEASEHWKVEVVKNLEGRTQLQRSLIEVDRGLARWRIEREHAQGVIAQWEEQAAPLSPKSRSTNSRFGAQPKTLDDWRDHLAQIDESIRENMETRKSLEEHLQQNKQAGKELQAQLPQRVLNEDLRAFLELIQRVQVLEVERLELDHMRERQRVQLEDRDQEIAMLREQLRLRNEHLRAQREQLSAEQKKNLPGRVSILGSTLAEPSPVQQRGPLRVMHAWAPPPREPEDLSKWDCRPLRERPPPPALSSPTNDDGEPRESLPSILNGMHGIDWRNVQVPSASQIRGIARIQPPGSCQRLAPKGWREPPELRPSPQPPAHPGPVGVPGSSAKPATSSAAQRAQAVGCSPRARRGNTCPPLRRPPSHEGPPPASRRVSAVDELAEHPRRAARPVGIPGAVGAPGMGAGGLGAPGRPVRGVPGVHPGLPRAGARERTPGHRGRRARSEQAGHLSRIPRAAGQGSLHTPGR